MRLTSLQCFLMTLCRTGGGPTVSSSEGAVIHASAHFHHSLLINEPCVGQAIALIELYMLDFGGTWISSINRFHAASTFGSFVHAR